MKIFFYLISFILLLSCTTTRPTGSTEAEVLFKEAKDLISKSRFIQATEKLNAIRAQYPYSYYATSAELLQADVLFSQENYPEAASAYILFRDFHPKYSDMGYVIFRISESFYRQLPSTFDRDLSSGIEAVKYYNELLQNYSQTQYVKDARERIDQIETMINRKDVYIADFYFRTKDYPAAVSRYEEILAKTNDSELKNLIQAKLDEAKNLDKKKE